MSNTDTIRTATVPLSKRENDNPNTVPVKKVKGIEEFRAIEARPGARQMIKMASDTVERELDTAHFELHSCNLKNKELRGLINSLNDETASQLLNIRHRELLILDLESRLTDSNKNRAADKNRVDAEKFLGFSVCLVAGIALGLLLHFL